jgi:branched-chain amino acid transport system substrate-binding protein
VALPINSFVDKEPPALMRRTRTLAVLVVLLLVAVACGQKPGVGSAEGDALSASTNGGTGSGSPEVSGAAESTSTTAAGSTDTSVAEGPATPGGSTGGAAAGGSTAPQQAVAGDRTGITDKEIVIGIHAPVTGAAPFPQSSFDQGREVYWRYLDGKGGVFSRRVRVVFADDNFNPATAKRVCQKMVEQDKVFLLVGGGGADQITACAQYANSVGVPYLSAGVNESGLRGLRGYFALSMTYAQQTPLLVQLAKNKLGGGKFAIAVAATPSFDDAHASISRQARAAGLDVVYDKRIAKDASQTQALAIANELRTSGAQIVYFLSSPTTFLNVASAAGGQAYIPKYIGPGVSSGLNTVANIGCPQIGEARFLSPFPQLDVIDRLDPDFTPAYRRFGGPRPDDIGLALWGLNKGLHQMFLAAGKDMTRQSFVQTLESGREFKTNIYPAVRFSGANHFGSLQAHLLQADCGSRTYKTAAQFASGF